jgi:hypothetical protein
VESSLAYAEYKRNCVYLIMGISRTSLAYTKSKQNRV